MNFSLENAGLEQHLLMSCFGETTGGGLFGFNGVGLEQIDSLSSTSLCIMDGKLARFLRASSPGFAELLLYDSIGVERYARFNSFSDPHQAMWDGESLVVASSFDNSITWIDKNLSVTNCWTAPGGLDSWHINGLTQKDGAIYATAFGRYDQFRKWDPRMKAGDGIIFNVLSGQTCVRGLACPHNSEFLDDAWFVCNSCEGELLEISEAGEILRRVHLGGFPRGVARTQDLMFVGVSAARHLDAGRRNAAVFVLSRDTWQVLQEIELPCEEVYDLALVPRDLVEGARRGFRTDPNQSAERDQHALFREAGIRPAKLWATGDPLPAEACRVKIDASVPVTLEANETIEISCTLENLGGEFLVSAPPYPVQLSYQWLPNGGGAEIAGLVTRLPRSLPPGESARGKMLLMAPKEDGLYKLRVTLLQHGVCWFHEIDPSTAFYTEVRIMPKASAGAEGPEA